MFKSIRNIKKSIVCVLLCVFIASGLSMQVFAETNTGIAENVRQARENTSISPEIDELLDLYLEFSLYDLTREEAILAMLRQFLREYDAVPQLADSLLSALDPFGRYISQNQGSQNSSMFFDNVFWGYGIMIDGKYMIDGHLYNAIIRRVFRDSPASGAGFYRGDEFISINGINVEGMGIAAVSNLLAAIEDTADFVMRRGDEEIHITLNKGTVFMPSMTVDIPFDSTFLIAIESFMDHFWFNDFQLTIEYARQEGFQNLILDLRGNSGGDLYLMENVLDMLVPEEGVVLYSMMFRGREPESFKSSGTGHRFERIVVLVDEITGSASETFAQSLREITGATIIGRQTHGKGIGQVIKDMTNGDLAFITALEILSSEGYSHHGRGITPDIIIEHEFQNVRNNTFERLHFVNSTTIRPGAVNNAVLGLNQRLARIGYITPEHVTDELNDRTVTAVEIFQKFHDLPVGISKIDNTFIDILNRRVSNAPMRYVIGDAVLDYAMEYIQR